jgi:hypothetical protein
MQTRTLAAAAVSLAVVPALVSIGCNKKEDLAPAPSATQAAAPPPAATPPPAPTPAPAPAPAPAALKVAVRGDAGAKDGATVVVALPDAAPVAIPSLPQIPTIHPSALPAIASGIVGGIVGALPSGLIPPPPAPSK